MSAEQPHTPVSRRFKPAVRSILLRSFRLVVWSLAFGVLAAALRRTNFSWSHQGASWGTLLAAALGGFSIAWQVLVWWSRVYTLTPERLTSTRGVFARRTVEIPLANVEQLVLDRTLGERLLGLGTICVTSAGSQTIGLSWVMIARPHERLALIRAACDASRVTPVRIVGVDPSELPDLRARTKPAIVIGLAGGIGAGKSAVAAELARLGFLVVDADKDAKEALDLPHVRDSLVKWWGSAILGPRGRIDRKAVARIIFSDPAERKRLESLVHPIVKSGRAALLDRARREARPGVVIDAPLLFEAGSDAECDYVIFVDAPRAVRARRVMASRGWDEAELDRRENAQIPLEDKRQRSDVVVVNDDTPEHLPERVSQALEQAYHRSPRLSARIPET